jgi:hypothetical protein
MAEVTGDDIKIRINGAVYKVAHASWDDHCGAGSISNSELPGYTLRLAGKATLSATMVNASYDPANNPFQAPLAVQSKSTVILLIYPAGLDEDPITCPSFLIDSCSGDHDANSPEGLAPITFKGESQGVYFMPGDEV